MGLIEFIREYFRGLHNAEYRELFICKGDLDKGFKYRGVVWIRGLDNLLSDVVRAPYLWNIFMGVGYVTIPGLTYLDCTNINDMRYDRLVFDFDDPNNPMIAISGAGFFASDMYLEYGATPIVFETGFKGAHVVIPLSEPIDWFTYQLLWKNLYSYINFLYRYTVDKNMLQWNRVDRVPLTYNIKHGERRFCRIVFPEEYDWDTFKWNKLIPLDPSRVRITHIELPRVVDVKMITPTCRKWIWRIVDRGLRDGRKRFLFHVLIPFLVSQGYSDDDIIKIAEKFLTNSCVNYKRCSKVYASFLRACIKSCRTRGFRGFGLRGIKSRDPELYNLILESLGEKQDIE